MSIEKIVFSFLVSLVLEACSEDNNMVVNDPLGETNAPASSGDVASVSSGDAVLVSSSSGEPVLGDDDQASLVGASNVDISESVYRGIKFYCTPSCYVRIFEMDTVTFDTTGFVNFDPFYGSEYGLDSVTVDSVSLKGPYVMIMNMFDRHLYNIVDLRQSNTFAIDRKTYYESARLVYLIRSGMSFAEARKQAAREVLETFGFFTELADRDESENIKNKEYRDYLQFIETFLMSTTEDTVFAKFEKCGNITCGTEFLKKRFVTESLNKINWINQSGYVPVGKNGEIDREDYNYRDFRNKVFYFSNFVAHLLDLGKCAAENEGKTFEILDREIVLNCRSGKWEFLYKEMEYTKGSMTDERDGKKYETVTYDMNGKPQTWMAEKLEYNAADLQYPCDTDSNFCGLYNVDGAMNLDYSSMYISVDSCLSYWHVKLEDIWSSTDTVWLAEQCEGRERRFDTLKYVNHMDSALAVNETYQGVCPDGWHIPSRNEWNALLDYMVESYRLVYPKGYDQAAKRAKIKDYLRWSVLGNPLGFGLTSDGSNFYVIDGVHAFSAMSEYDYERGSYVARSFVRCVKN